MEGILGEGVRHILVPGFATEGVEQDQLQKQVMYKDKSFFKIFSVCLFAFMHTLIPSLSPHQGAYLFQASLRGDLIEMGAYLIVFIRHQRLENSLANVQ